MRSILSLSALFAVAAAVPLVEYDTQPIYSLQSSPIGKQDVGAFDLPSAFASTLNTGAGPVNYGNVNKGTGLMPTQVVHYGTENQPDHGFISPALISTTAKEVDFQVSKAQKVKDSLVNADLDVGKLKLTGGKDFSKYTGDYDDDYDEDASKYGMYGYGYGYGYPYYGYRWYRYHPRYWY
ncbi:hypothetical protein EDD11_002697 [Mortierella claussenii]|nr:hypothetical protein EDD11_002697 [Mortierella claussenii]